MFNIREVYKALLRRDPFGVKVEATIDKIRDRRGRLVNLTDLSQWFSKQRRKEIDQLGAFVDIYGVTQLPARGKPRDRRGPTPKTLNQGLALLEAETYSVERGGPKAMADTTANILKMFYREHLSQVTIARELDCSRVNVSNILKRHKARMNEVLKGLDLTDRQQDIAQRFFIRGQLQVIIAVDLGITQPAVSGVVTRINKRILLTISGKSQKLLKKYYL